MKGSVYVNRSRLDYAASLDLDPRPFESGAGGDLYLVFSRVDFATVPRRAPLIFVEHGVGANYEGKSHIVAGSGAGPASRVAAVLTTPAQEPAHRQVFGSRVRVVGCPKLDAWRGYKHKKGRPPVVAFSHHWEQRTYPETRSAWPWDAEAWSRVITSGKYRVLGHKHPGDPRPVDEWCRKHGIEFVPTFDEVLRRADLYVADNSSTLYEFAATGRPVVVLSPPWYRRKVSHGARFWDHVPGVECALAGHLKACIEEALKDVPGRRELRERSVEAVYGALDGKATERAVEVIVELAARFPEGAKPDGMRPAKHRLVTYRNAQTGSIVTIPARSGRRMRYERAGWYLVDYHSEVDEVTS